MGKLYHNQLNSQHIKSDNRYFVTNINLKHYVKIIHPKQLLNYNESTHQSIRP